MQSDLGLSWSTHLSSEFSRPYFTNLSQAVDLAYQTQIIYPPREQIFQAFTLCSLAQLKVVILGQDPYHQPGQAHGLAFSVPPTEKIPPSLRNIYQEIKNDIGTPPPNTGDLTRWANQGVLLLNSTLTVEQGRAGAHHGWGWEHYTDQVIQIISEEKAHVVFLLWGKHAQAKASLIDETKHLILTAAHPSPLSAYRGFFGCQHFSRANEYLCRHGKQPINW